MSCSANQRLQLISLFCIYFFFLVTTPFLFLLLAAPVFLSFSAAVLPSLDLRWSSLFSTLWLISVFVVNFTRRCWFLHAVSPHLSFSGAQRFSFRHLLSIGAFPFLFLIASVRLAVPLPPLSPSTSKSMKDKAQSPSSSDSAPLPVPSSPVHMENGGQVRLDFYKFIINL